MKEYKIDKSKIIEYICREEGNGRKYLIFIIICLPFILYYYLRQQGFEDDFVWALIVCFTSPFLIISLIIPIFNQIKKIRIQNMTIIIDDTSIIRKINPDIMNQFNIFQRFALCRTPRYYFQNIQIEFNDLLSQEFVNGNLVIKCKKSNSFTGKNVIIIPQEFDGIREIESIIEEKLNL